ncbi:hypothetical protein CUC15_17930 [Oceanobacillus zhaokaii]|uniref:Uncharacterized protein n=1 Tax=Oceanobacillus zhaokaii TaxID=2052660 RepID=A0A345PL26_9BACI|nr:hypothetical protein [Oceanobacillus zhaokaii]AXI10706.1 hypothetical protein CUC15_17930 [Oceanobacillus zhaokaii]
MKEKTIYFLFTDTGTVLSRTIHYCMRTSYNHVSISYDSTLKNVYSFGRKNPNNPFIGGFVKEDIQSEFFKKSECAIYRYQLSEAEYQSIIRNIEEIEARKQDYKYNFIGLFGILLQIEIKRKNAFFCSQFVATVLKDSERFQFGKPASLTTPADLRMSEGMQLIYQGRLEDYQPEHAVEERKLVIGEQISPRQSFTFFISNTVKRFVTK